MNKIYTYNNGIKFYNHTIGKIARERAERFINLHEPFEETVFDHIFKNYNIGTFVDLGSAWGYYSFLAKKLSKETRVIAFDPDQRRCKHLRTNMELNDINDIDIRNGRIPNDFKLSDVIDEVEQIDLIKIDIQGAGTNALKSAEKEIVNIKNVILGTHGKEHDDCLKLLKDSKFDIKLDFKADQIPIQPDGLIWANRE